MANPDFFKPEFDRHAVNGVIGDPSGEPAYGYLRVSSKGQAEEGRSGLPRQIECIHQKAKQERYSISWDMMYADDHTGFDFEDRPQLQKLLKEIKTNKKAKALFVEKLDRLSRKGWHQEYLYELITELGISIQSFIPISSRIERSVIGAISEEGMLDNIRRMKDGTRKKLESGRITAKVPAYGYRFVDSSGGTEKVKRDTHYQIYEPEAKVIRIIFEMVANGSSLMKVCEALQGVYPTIKRAKAWHPIDISNIIKSRLYVGEYVGNRFLFIKETKPNGKKVIKKTRKPESEWIRISIPAIVDEPLWQAANAMLKKNALMSKRNGKYHYLLTGLVKCASCGFTFSGGSRDAIAYYRCSSYSKPKPIRDVLGCKQISIQAKIFEDMIWGFLFSLITTPEKVKQFYERKKSNEKQEELQSQIKFLKSQLEACDLADRKIKDGYNAGLYTVTEAKEERELIQTKREKLTVNLQDTQGNLTTQDQLEAQQQLVLKKIEIINRKKLQSKVIPDDIKLDLIKSFIEKIVLNTLTRRVEVYGVIETSFNYDENYTIDYTSVNKGITNLRWMAVFYLDNPGEFELVVVG